MTAGFPHHSRPGHYGTRLAPELQQFVATMASALIPGSEEYPAGSEAQVDVFVAERASGDDVERLTAIAERWPADTVDQAASSLARMEQGDPMAFLYLRELVFHGYYSSRRVLAAMVDRGYRYHGAPQPLGYPKTEELLLPSERRGSFIPTDEVTRVSY